MNARSTLLTDPFANNLRGPVRIFLCLTAMLAALPAHAIASQGCRPTDSLLVCRLQSVLTLLYTAAAILALLLTLAIGFAVRAFRRKSRKLTPDDIASDSD